MLNCYYKTKTNFCLLSILDLVFKLFVVIACLKFSLREFVVNLSDY